MSGREYDFQISAVTDSKLLFGKRSLSASSARCHFENVETIGAGGVQPEYVADLGILGHKTEIENRIRD